MSFDWNDFLLLAKNLNGESFTHDISVAKYRTAISRSYYAAFNICKSYIVDFFGVDLESEKIRNIRAYYKVKDHGLIPKLMLTSNNKEICKKATRLDTLRGRRKDADYNSERIENITRKTKDTIEEAEKIIAAMELFENGQADLHIDNILN